ATKPVNPIGHFSLTSKHFSRIMDRESMVTSRLRTVVLSASLAIGLVAGTTGMARLGAAAPQMNVDEIRPGMIGVGRTVFDGTRVEEFKVHVLGVLQNVVGPHRSLILARLEGGPL